MALAQIDKRQPRQSGGARVPPTHRVPRYLEKKDSASQIKQRVSLSWKLWNEIAKAQTHSAVFSYSSVVIIGN
jgi:hypothetical protein